ncbi:MAG: hypothetical protein JEZ10_07530 [Verrucomicrobia bacterium]|nr:hypothetical protein [Verrucomicrobiota bacterium]
MSLRLLSLLYLLAIIPLNSFGFLPTTAEFRAKEVLEYREFKKAEYAQAQVEHEQEMVSSRYRVQSLMAAPQREPFRASGGSPVGLTGMNKAVFETEKNSRRWSLAVMALLFIGASVCLTRHLLADPDRP